MEIPQFRFDVAPGFACLARGAASGPVADVLLYTKTNGLLCYELDGGASEQMREAMNEVEYLAVKLLGNEGTGPASTDIYGEGLIFRFLRAWEIRRRSFKKE